MKELLLLFKDKKENPPKREDFLKKALQDCQQSLEDAYCGLQNTNEPDLIDRYIYELNAANLRYKVLLRDIKEVSEEIPSHCLSIPTVVTGGSAAATSEPLTVPADSLSLHSEPLAIPAKPFSTSHGS